MPERPDERNPRPAPRMATADDYDENGEPARLEDPDGTPILFWEYYVDEFGYG